MIEDDRKIDVTKVTLVDTIECPCGFQGTYARSLADTPITACPKCQSKGIYIKVEFGSDMNAPTKPSIRTTVHSSPFDNMSIQELSDLLDVEGEEWKDGEEPEIEF